MSCKVTQPVFHILHFRIKEQETFGLRDSGNWATAIALLERCDNADYALELRPPQG